MSNDEIDVDRCWCRV